MKDKGEMKIIKNSSYFVISRLTEDIYSLRRLFFTLLLTEPIDLSYMFFIVIHETNEWKLEKEPDSQEYGV